MSPVTTWTTLGVQFSLSYIARPCLRNKQTNKPKTRTEKNSTQEAETGRSGTVTARAGYTEKPCLEKLKTKKQKQKQASKQQQKLQIGVDVAIKKKKVPTASRQNF